MEEATPPGRRGCGEVEAGGEGERMCVEKAGSEETRCLQLKVQGRPASAASCVDDLGQVPFPPLASSSSSVKWGRQGPRGLRGGLEENMPGVGVSVIGEGVRPGRLAAEGDGEGR